MAKPLDGEIEAPNKEGWQLRPPLCVYCSAPWTDDMIKLSSEASIDHGYYPGEFSLEQIDTVVDITCSTCKRLVYRKEIRSY